MNAKLETNETKRVRELLEQDLRRLKEDFRENSINHLVLTDKVRDFFYDLRDEAIKDPKISTVKILLHIGSLDRVDWDHLGQIYW